MPVPFNPRSTDSVDRKGNKFRTVQWCTTLSALLVGFLLGWLLSLSETDWNDVLYSDMWSKNRNVPVAQNEHGNGFTSIQNVEDKNSSCEKEAPAPLHCRLVPAADDPELHWMTGGPDKKGHRCCPFAGPMNPKQFLGAIRSGKGNTCCVNNLSYFDIFGGDGAKIKNDGYPPYVNLTTQCWPELTTTTQQLIDSKARTIAFVGDSLTMQLAQFWLCEMWRENHVIGAITEHVYGWGWSASIGLKDKAGELQRTITAQTFMSHESPFAVETLPHDIVVMGVSIAWVAKDEDGAAFANFTNMNFEKMVSLRPVDKRGKALPTIAVEPWPTHWKTPWYWSLAPHRHGPCVEHLAAFDGKEHIFGQPLQDYLANEVDKFDFTLMRGVTDILKGLGGSHAKPNYHLQGQEGLDCLHWCADPVITALVVKGLNHAIATALHGTPADIFEKDYGFKYP